MLRRNPNRQKNRFGWLAAVLLTGVLLTCVMGMGVMASETDRMPDPEPGRMGSLAVTMAYTGRDGEDGKEMAMPDVQVKLAQVAGLQVSGGSAVYTLLDAYQSTGIEFAGMTASQSNGAAQKLAAVAAAENSVRTAVTDSRGLAAFDGLEPGMYLVFQDADANAAYQVEAIAAFLAAVPYPVQSAEGNGWQYAVQAQPKTELPGPRKNGVLRVRKQLYDTENELAYYPPENEEIIFYVGLFTDEACTVRAEGTSDVPLRFLNNGTAEAVFENLTTDRTYYIAETDGQGNVVEFALQGETMFEALYPGGQSVEITRQNPEGEILFQNTTFGIPDGYFYIGKLTITKNTEMDGSEYETDDVFYAGIFTDENLSTLYGEVIPLKMGGNSSVSVKLDVEIGATEEDSVIYYVAETDSEGNPLSSDGQEFTISMNKPDGKVSFSMASLNDEVIITNDFTEKIPTEPEPTRQPSVSPIAAPSPSPGATPSAMGSSGTDSPKTGDDTPVMLFAALMAAAIAVILGVVFVRKRRGKK